MSTPLDRKRLDELNTADLMLLIENQVSEGKTIDFKRILPGITDKDRKEFLHDVASFANASGGHLVFGIDEAQGIATEILGLRDIDPDKEALRLEEVIRSGIRPRIYGIQIRGITIENGAFVIVIRIPKSWNPPHQVTFQSDMRFSARGQRGKYLMDVDELRSTLELANTVGEKARNFRLERVAKVLANETPSQGIEGGHVIFHFLPLSAFSGGSSLEFARNHGHYPFEVPPLMPGGFNHRYCFDGYLFTQGYPSQNSYRLFFRSGVMEYVDFYPTGQDPYAFRLNSIVVENFVRQCLEHALKTAQTLEIDPPAFVALSLTGMKGWIWSVGDRLVQPPISRFDRDPLLFSENFLDGLDCNLDEVHKTIVDPVWQATGWEHSMNFQQGKWTPNSP